MDSDSEINCSKIFSSKEFSCGEESLKNKNYRQEIIKTMNQVKEIHLAMQTLHDTNETYLKDIAIVLKEMKTDFVNAIIGKEQIPKDMANEMLKGQRQTFLLVIRTICWSFATITAVLVGLKAIFPHFL